MIDKDKLISLLISKEIPVKKDPEIQNYRLSNKARKWNSRICLRQRRLLLPRK